MSGGSQILEQYRRQLSVVDEARFILAHEGFLRALSVMDRNFMDRLGQDDRVVYRAFFSQCQKRYLAMKEKEAHNQLMSVIDSATRSIGEKIVNGFGRESYERVRDLKDLVDFRSCENVVMVGSGAFPATLFWLHDHFPGLRYTGLDIDAGCVEMATTLVAAMGLQTMHFRVADGSDFDFDGTDFVYVANHVVPKKAVLQRITHSVTVAQVVVREPTRKGELLAEAVRHDLPSGFIVQRVGSKSRAFLSYDLLLKRHDPSHIAA